MTTLEELDARVREIERLRPVLDSWVGPDGNPHVNRIQSVDGSFAINPTEAAFFGIPQAPDDDYGVAVPIIASSAVAVPFTRVQNSAFFYIDETDNTIIRIQHPSFLYDRIWWVGGGVDWGGFGITYGQVHLAFLDENDESVTSKVLMKTPGSTALGKTSFFLPICPALDTVTGNDSVPSGHYSLQLILSQHSAIDPITVTDVSLSIAIAR